MNNTTVLCEECGKDVVKPTKEYSRSLKRGRKFFCNNSCQSIYHNRSRKCVPIQKTCPFCDIEFIGSTSSKSKIYCSRGCASAGSMNNSEYRREQQRLSGIAHSYNLIKDTSITLKSREKWKYVEVDKYLYSLAHEFEFRLGPYVFDLYLSDQKLLIEFDGPNHLEKSQSLYDKIKDTYVISIGFKVLRINVQSNTVIPSDLIRDSLAIAKDDGV